LIAEQVSPQNNRHHWLICKMFAQSHQLAQLLMECNPACAFIKKPGANYFSETFERNLFLLLK